MGFYPAKHFNTLFNGPDFLSKRHLNSCQEEPVEFHSNGKTSFRKNQQLAPRMKNIALPTAGLIVVNDNKLLLAYSKNKNAWYLPGGKVDVGESSLQALQREIQEELNITLNADRLTFYCHITAPAYGEEPAIIMEQDCFLYELNEKIQPGGEIENVHFFDLQIYKLEPAQVAGVLEVFENLIKDNLLQSN